MANPDPNLLLVEGMDEKRVIPYFMDSYVVWGDKEEDWVVHIKEVGGVEKLHQHGVISTASKVPRLRALGILIDADDQFDSRWSRVRERCREIAPGFPDELPPTGLIHETGSGLRIGVWIMPDNRSRGMLESFLSGLLLPDRAALWTFAQEACDGARSHGAPYSDAHRDKANIHTYLAWLNPPGQSLNVSVLARALDPRHPLGEPFAQWFMNLFALTPRATPLGGGSPTFSNPPTGAA